MNTSRKRTGLAARVAAGYLAACFALCGLVAVSPWLHQLVEHGSLDPRHGHVHVLQHWVGSDVHGTGHRGDHHPHHPGGSGGADPVGDDSGRGHEHHGLPDALASGLVALADPMTLPGPAEPGTPVAVLGSQVPLRSRFFDPTQAPRAPPASPIFC